jgi:hypothetical protein
VEMSRFLFMVCGVGESGVSGRRGLVVGNILESIVTRAGSSG